MTLTNKERAILLTSKGYGKTIEVAQPEVKEITFTRDRFGAGSIEGIQGTEEGIDCIPLIVAIFPESDETCEFHNGNGISWKRLGNLGVTYEDIANLKNEFAAEGEEDTLIRGIQALSTMTASQAKDFLHYGEAYKTCTWDSRYEKRIY